MKNQCVEIGKKKEPYRTWSYYDENAGKLEDMKSIL